MSAALELDGITKSDAGRTVVNGVSFSVDPRDVFRRVGPNGSGKTPAWEVAASLATVVASGVVLLWVSARVFRTGLLVYGQRKTVRSAWIALRAGG